MSIIKDALHVLRTWTAEGETKVGEYLGHPYSINRNGAVALDHPPLPPWVTNDVACLTTLNGFAGLLAANPNEWDYSKMVVVIEPALVTLTGPLEWPWKKRRLFVQATYAGERMGTHQRPLQQFRLDVMRAFEENEERQRLLNDTAAFRFKNERVREERTDGLGMSVQDKRSQIAGTEHKIDTPVYNLLPWRMFPEAGPQVVVPHLLQISGGEDEETVAALYDVGGNAWQAEAAKAVGRHVESLLADGDVDIAVVW